MKDLRQFLQYAITHPLWGLPTEDGGAYRIGGLLVIASKHAGWDHISVSRQFRAPNWSEMELIKRMFFEDHEVAMQLHVAIADHKNIHPHCLHIWRPHHQEIPLPPKEFV